MTLGEGLGLFATLITICVAVYGLDSWRREHSGRRQIELAEDTLALFYEAADALRHIRHPASFGYETKDITRHDGERDAEFSARKNASIVFVRTAQYSELFNKLHSMRYRFMAQIGKDQAKPFEDIRRIVLDVENAASSLARLWPREDFRTEGNFASHCESVEQLENIFGWGPKDPITPRVEKVIEAIEVTCRAVIAGSGTLYGALNMQLGKRRGVEKSWPETDQVADKTGQHRPTKEKSSPVN
ncbi:hypothetical protein ACN9MB_13610 [Dyella kyungheensis]|uniref:hypothetical protein n=1 Tax=Dyella kyungheensis TaxID=1242174 RepID=UPI003CE71BD4